MKKITLNLFIGVLAIGITTSVMAEKKDKPEAICDLATLKGVYSYYNKTIEATDAGEFKYNGDGTGTYAFIVKFEKGADKEDVTYSGVFNYLKDSLGECHFTFTLPFSPEIKVDVFAENSGDTYAWSSSSAGNTGYLSTGRAVRGKLPHHHLPDIIH